MMKEKKIIMPGSTKNKKRLNYSRAAEIQRLEELAKSYAKQIEVEQEKIKEIDIEISNTESELNKQRKSLGASENACKVSTENMKRKANVLDKRVNQMFAKLNKAVADNREAAVAARHKQRPRASGIRAPAHNKDRQTRPGQAHSPKGPPF